MGNALFADASVANANANMTEQNNVKLYIWGQDLVQDHAKMKDNSEFVNTLDYIACHYILTMDFSTMKNLYNKEYCDKLVILTGDILNRYYSELDIQRMRERIEYGDNYSGVGEKEAVLYAQKKDIDNVSIPNKLLGCSQIAKFYVKIGHLFAAVLMTIHPKYEYIDPISGTKITKTLQQKSEIPANVKVAQYSSGLCHEKMNILLGNLNNSNNSSSSSSNISIKREKTLAEETGIPELIDLYYDSEYNHTTGEFQGMTERTHKRFLRDLEDFYKVFTQNNKMPADITKFSDIKLNDYYGTEIEKENPEEAESTKLVGGGEKEDKKNNRLLQDYARNLKTMMRSVNFYQKKLLHIIDKIFIRVDNDVVRISPKLMERQLREFIEDARDIIVELYLNCEENFVKGIKIYEAIVENIIFQTTQNQIETLEIVIENMHSHQPFRPPQLPSPLPLPSALIQNTINFFKHSM